MSHFAIIVIGNNPEEQLAAYHEFECTGINNEFVQEIDVTQETKEDYKRNKKDYKNAKEFLQDYYGRRTVESEKEVNIEGEQKYGYAILNKNGSIKKVIKRTNPNAKWDWYVLGGRWTGFFKKINEHVAAEVGRPGLMTEQAQDGYGDQLRKSDIDFEFMENESAKKASHAYPCPL